MKTSLMGMARKSPFFAVFEILQVIPGMGKFETFDRVIHFNNGNLERDDLYHDSGALIVTIRARNDYVRSYSYLVNDSDFEGASCKHSQLRVFCSVSRWR